MSDAASGPSRPGPLASWWVLLPFVPLGQLSWTAFLYAGVRARKPSWFAFAALYFALGVGGLVVAEFASFGFWLVLGSWVASIVHGLAIRGEYLDRLALFESGAFDRAEARALAREEARRIARRDPRHALELGIGRPEAAGFHGGLDDLNNADADAIAKLPGVGRALAERIVRVREEVNGFSSLDDLALVLDLPAPLVDRIRPDVVVLPRGSEG